MDLEGRLLEQPLPWSASTRRRHLLTDQRPFEELIGGVLDDTDDRRCLAENTLGRRAARGRRAFEAREDGWESLQQTGEASVKGPRSWERIRRYSLTAYNSLQLDRALAGPSLTAFPARPSSSSSLSHQLLLLLIRPMRVCSSFSLPGPMASYRSSSLRSDPGAE